MLAEVAGVDQSTVSKIENGWDGATIRNLKLIAQALGVPVYQLFMDETTPAEVNLISIYRSLPDDRKKGWQDMAALAQTDSQKEDQ